MKHKHEELGLRLPEYIALLGVRALLVNGEVDYEPDCIRPRDNSHSFNMNITMRRGLTTASECGTIGCIGGYMALTMGIYDMRMLAIDYDAPLRPLFFPNCSIHWEHITTDMAVDAIDNFLRDGDPHWQRVVEAHSDEL
jgi:hypothetical protein